MQDKKGIKENNELTSDNNNKNDNQLISFVPHKYQSTKV